MRTFTFTDDKSNKFWNIELQGNKFTVQFGKIGTAGQTQIKEFANAAAAQKEHDKLVAEKLKKGYTETTAGGTPASKATPAPASPPAAAPTPAPSVPKAKKAASTPPAPTPPPAPPAPAPAPPSVAAAPKASAGLRTFEYSDATSHKFWNIELQGTGFTVTYGRIGTTGQTQVKSFSDEAKARKEHDKLVDEKVKKGYRETTPSAAAQPTSIKEALEMALVENPLDLASHMAYADYLTEEGDPRGDFIRVQLALEDASKSPAERKKLQQQEKKLLDQNFNTWMGDLSPWLKGEINITHYGEFKAKYSFARGWLDTLEVEYYTTEFTRILAKSPQIKLLRRLVLRQDIYEENVQPGDDIPEGANSPQLYPLARCPHLGNVREFILGEAMTPEEDSQSVDYGFSCHTNGDGVVGMIKLMPKLEELQLLAHRVDTEQLFSLKTLHNLRILLVYHNHSYPLGRLAKNSSLGNVTHLLFHPHALEYGDEDEEDEGAGGYLRHPAVKALVDSPNLPALTHLRLRLSDIGDKGVKTIIQSGILKRLKMLDLCHGRITDAGAKLFAACPDLKKLELLNLRANCLTEEGIKALEATGVKLLTDHQWQMTNAENNEYLFMGDVE